MKSVTSEEAWAILDKEGYLFQFEGNWFRTHPDRILVGRAVTAQMMPYRPDLHAVVQETGIAQGRIGGQNLGGIDTLQPNDVLVVELVGKNREGAGVGDKPSTYVPAPARAGGALA